MWHAHQRQDDEKFSKSILKNSNEKHFIEELLTFEMNNNAAMKVQYEALLYDR